MASIHSQACGYSLAMLELSEATPSEKTDSPSPVSYQFPISPQPEVGLPVLITPTPLYAGIFPA